MGVLGAATVVSEPHSIPMRIEASKRMAKRFEPLNASSVGKKQSPKGMRERKVR